jgi:hypothetical protein
MYLIPVPAFADNYLWLLHDGKRALVADPGDAGPVPRRLAQHGPQLASILVMRTRQAPIMAAARRFDGSTHGDNTVFAAVRQWKNQFK